MATIRFKVGDEYAQKLSRIEKYADEIAKKAIAEGAGVIADKVRSNMNAVLSGKSSGDMQNSMGISPPKQDKDGNWNVKIGFDGYDRKGTSNALKATVIEYGKKSQPAKPFVKPAVTSTRSSALQKMRDVIDAETKKYIE